MLRLVKPVQLLLTPSTAVSGGQEGEGEGAMVVWAGKSLRHLLLLRSQPGTQA
jgi:hypothetical protein